MAHTKECIKAWSTYRKAWQAYKVNKENVTARQDYFNAGDVYAEVSSKCNK